MRFHQALELEKQRSKQDQFQEEKEQVLGPSRQIINSYYFSAKKWSDPIGASFSRIEFLPKDKLETANIPSQNIKSPNVVFSLSGSVGSSQSLNQK